MSQIMKNDDMTFDQYLQHIVHEDQRPVRKKIKTTVTKTRYVAIDSDDRDKTVYTNPASFWVRPLAAVSFNATMSDDAQFGPYPRLAGGDATFEEELKNITEISLQECLLPDFTSDFPYLVLRIDSLGSAVMGTSKGLRNAFSILISEKDSIGGYTSCKPFVGAKTFTPPLAKLPSMKIEIYNPEGTLVKFEEDDTVFILFKMKYQVPNMQQTLLPSSVF